MQTEFGAIAVKVARANHDMRFDIPCLGPQTLEVCAAARVAVLALEAGVIAVNTSYLIQLATLLTFVVSSALIVLRYPTPIAVSDRLRRD